MIEVIWFTSDLHFGHNKPFLFEPRGFTEQWSMMSTIIQNWNSVVQPNDTVYNLGDIALTDINSAITFLHTLNGNQIWLRGNHDTDNKITLITQECPRIKLLAGLESSYATVLKDGKWRFYLSHYPTKVGNYDDKALCKTWCLCGHTHTQDKWHDFSDNCYHVEMDAHNCYPVSIDQIKEDIRNKHLTKT